MLVIPLLNMAGIGGGITTLLYTYVQILTDRKITLYSGVYSFASSCVRLL